MVEYDFYINENGRFIVPEYNIDFLFSPRESEIPDIPESDETSVQIVGRDGDLPLSTRYESRKFSLVLYTEDNLTPIQKQEEIDKVSAFLNSIKQLPKKLAFLERNRMYDVKIYATSTTERYPRFVKFTIPLKSSEPFATSLTKTIIEGSGSKVSNTIEETGCIIEILGPVNNPRISLNDYQMEYNNVVLEGNKLIIDTNNSTITHITSAGVKTNAALYYNHEYPKIKNGNNTIAILNGILNSNQVTTKWYDIKY